MLLGRRAIAEMSIFVAKNRRKNYESEPRKLMYIYEEFNLI